MKLVWASVAAVEAEREDLQHLSVTVDGKNAKAVCYTHLAGVVTPGELVLLNTTAADMELGTGGVHFVVARSPQESLSPVDRPSGGHIMKLRYTPLQVDVVAVESPESPHHDVMKNARSLSGMPVVCCGLHSQAPLVAAAVTRADPALRVAYCMTDGAALPMSLSELVSASKEAGLIDATVSCGQAFGGDIEAVNLHSGLLAARLVALADVAIVAIGPGVVGTGTPFGHGGISQGEAINAAAAVGGDPIACLRISFADERERHRGVSHHSVAALTSVALASCRVALPTLPEEMGEAVDKALEEARIWDRHRRYVSEEGRVAPPSLMGVNVRTMGREYAADPAFFSAAFAAGEVAASVAAGELDQESGGWSRT